MRPLRIFSLTLLGFGLVSTLAAQDAVHPAAEAETAALLRPGLAEDAAVLGMREAVIEGGYSLLGSRTGRTHSIGELMLRVGINGWSELHMAANSYMVDATGEGMEDPYFGVKAQLPVKGTKPWIPQAGLLAGSTLLAGGEAAGQHALQPEALLALVWDVTSRWGVRVNLHYLHASVEGERIPSGEATLSLGYAAAQRWGVFVEHGRGGSLQGGPGATSSLVGGASVLISPTRQIDLSVGRGLSGMAEEYLLGVGFSLQW